MRNLITDVPGVLVGNAQDMRAATGATVAIFEQGAVASVATLGGAPGDRMVTSLEPEMVGQMIDAVVLSGGSVYGLDAAGGASAVLCQRGQGRTFGGLAIPVAVQAILFDLINGGEKDWMRAPVTIRPPYWDLGRDAALVAAHDFALGTAGAGVGATTAGLKGGLGSTSAKTSQGFTVGALTDDGTWAWTWVLEPAGGGTRLLSRTRMRTAGSSLPARAATWLAMVPASWVMERRMLLGLRRSSKSKS